MDLVQLQTHPATAVTRNAMLNLTDVFADRKGTYLNEFNLFVICFNTIPNFIHEVNIDCTKANKWFAHAYKDVIKDTFFDKRYFNKKRQAELDDVFYFLYEDLVVYFDTNQSVVRFLFRKTDYAQVEKTIKEIKRFRYRRVVSKPTLSLLVHSFHGIDTKTFQLVKPKMSLEDNYNYDFMEVHKAIIKRLAKRNDKGLVLLHGKPGTGKTSYIRYLVSIIKKNVIFLPPNMAAAITNPELISILIDNPNSVFVIEDAENIVVDREKGACSPVSALLNITDGLLSDCLNIQIVCSFNTDISKVDRALMRKGRLIAKYEFKELDSAKASNLSKKLGFSCGINKPMTLAEIYNQAEKGYVQPNNPHRIGFSTLQINHH